MAIDLVPLFGQIVVIPPLKQEDLLTAEAGGSLKNVRVTQEVAGGFFHERNLAATLLDCKTSTDGVEKKK